MEISFDHEFIFIHVPRTGGSSVTEALRPHAHVPTARLVDRVPVVRKVATGGLYRLWAERYGHAKAAQIAARLPEETFAAFFTFAFVRNPWDWQVSYWHYITQRRDHPDHEHFTSSFANFAEYLDWRLHDEGAELQGEWVRGGDGALLVDFVGRFEALDRDFSEATRRIGLECALPHTNRSSHGDFHGYYTPETRGWVARAYADDIALFGYTFEPQPALPALIRR